MKVIPLDELEMFELVRAAYPEKFKDDNDETWELAQQFVEDISGWEDVAELLGRIVMLTPPMKSGLTERNSHCLGVVTVKDNEVHMMAAVRRDAVLES